MKEVQVVPVKPHNGLIASASCVVDDSLYLGGIAIYTKLKGEGFRLVYPTKKIGDTNIPIFRPICKDATEAIQRTIIEKLEKLYNLRDQEIQT